MLNLIDWFRGGAPIKEELAAWCWALTERGCWERLQRSPLEPQKMFQWDDKRERERERKKKWWRSGLHYGHHQAHGRCILTKRKLHTQEHPESSHRIAVNLETRCWERFNSVGECYSAGESDRHQLQIGSPDVLFFFFFFYPFVNFYYWVSASYICFCLCLLSYYSWTAHWHHSHNPSEAAKTCFLSFFWGAVLPYE